LEDTAIKVASEMVQELNLPDSCVQEVAQRIQTQVDQLQKSRNLIIPPIIHTSSSTESLTPIPIINTNSIENGPKSPRQGDFIRFSDGPKSPRHIDIIHPPEKPVSHYHTQEHILEVDPEWIQFLEKQRLEKMVFENKQQQELEEFKAKLMQKLQTIINNSVIIDPFSLGGDLVPRITPLQPQKTLL